MTPRQQILDAIEAVLRAAEAEQASATKLDIASLSKEIADVGSQAGHLKWMVGFTILLVASTYGATAVLTWKLFDTLVTR